MKISTFAFIGSLLAIRLEKVHSDNNEVNQEHRKDEEVVSVDEIVGESSIGSVRAGRRNDKDKVNKRQQRNKRTDAENDKPEKKDLSGNKRGSDETDKSNGKRGGGGRRGGRNADDNEESQETNDEKRGGRGRGGGDDGGKERKNNKRGNRVGQGNTSGNHKKHDNKKKQRMKEGRKFRKRLDLEGEQMAYNAEALVSPFELVGGVPPPAEIVPPLAEEEVVWMEEEGHTMDKKLIGKSDKEPPVESEVEHGMMEKEDNLMAKSFKESVHKGPHEQAPTEDNLMAKSVKESVHKGPHEQVPVETTYESANTVEASANKFASAGTSKRKQRHEKPSREWRRRNHPRQPPPPSGGNDGGRFAVPSAAKQRTPGKQRHGGLASKNDKTAP